MKRQEEALVITIFFTVKEVRRNKEAVQWNLKCLLMSCWHQNRKYFPVGSIKCHLMQHIRTESFCYYFYLHVHCIKSNI